jgi:hypothetical protein
MPKIRDGALTPKQRAFVEIFVKENGRLTATECAKQAGYSEKSAVSQSCNLRNPKYFPKVVEAIENLQREYAEASKLDFVKHSRELSRLRDHAVTNGQLGPAVQAEYRRGQLAGFYVDRKEVVTASLDNMTRPELEAKLKEIRDHNVINGEAIGVEVTEVIETENSEDISIAKTINPKNYSPIVYLLIKTLPNYPITTHIVLSSYCSTFWTTVSFKFTNFFFRTATKTFSFN